MTTLIRVLIISLIVFSACKNKKPVTISAPDIVVTIDELNTKSAEHLSDLVEEAAANGYITTDSTRIRNGKVVGYIYDKESGKRLWSTGDTLLASGDSLYHFIANAKHYGLYPEHYHFSLLKKAMEEFQKDTLSKSAKKDAMLWAKTDILLTDAFISLAKHLRDGRLPGDSVSLRKDTIFTDDDYLQQLHVFIRGGSPSRWAYSLEPKHDGYKDLKTALASFLGRATFRSYTKVPGIKDPAFTKVLQTRLFEEGFISQDTLAVDSSTLSQGVKGFQKDRNIEVDGKTGSVTLRMLNLDDHERFARIAITLDRYKLLPAKMPEKYIWVNIPAYAMYLKAGDSIPVRSKVIVGKPHTRTPLLNSAISEIITYPQWTVPASIIQKEILPAVKRNPGYLAKKDFSLVDGNGEVVDPYSVDWAKYTKGIPYKVVQGSGDANALGILKFNFPNKYAVYLHDTNQRSLFSMAMRSLSHGCVRVQEWKKLANYIILNDSKVKEGNPPALDSMNVWLQRKEKHSLAIKNRIPVFIRYFTCEPDGDRIIFHDDVYGEDKMLREKYLSVK